MSLLAVTQAVQATVTATPSPSPTPSPSVAPVAVQAAQGSPLDAVVGAVVNIVSNVSQADLLVLAAALAVGVQYLINHYKPLGKVTNYLVSFTTPSLLAGLAAALGGVEKLAYGPLIYVGAQVLYFLVERARKQPVAEQF